MKYLKYLIPSLLVIAAIACYSCITEHESYSVETVEFVVEKPYLIVAKEVATKNSLEKIVEQQNGAVKGKQWTKFEVEVPQRILKLKEYSLNGEMNFVVEKNDPSLGNLILPFKQQIHMDRNMFLIETQLSESNRKIPTCSRNITISPNLDDQSLPETHIKISSSLKVKTKIFFFLKDVMDQKVKESNKTEIENTKNTLMSITNDTSPILSLKRK
jgi:hypothetical protein